ncbi:MAG: carboxypeptidase regulatory-like domain-containing protein [Thermoanaerobaculia bacterium]
MTRTAGPAATPRWGASPVLIRHAVRALAVVLSLPAAFGSLSEEPPPTRTLVLRVVDRLERPVTDVSACLLPACAKVPLRAATDGLVAELPAGEEPKTLRLSARSFGPADLVVAPEATTAKATMKAKGSVRVAFLAPEGKETERLTVSLKETIDPNAGTKGRLLAEKAVDVPPRPATSAVVLDDVPPGDWVLGWEGTSIAAGMKVLKVTETRAEVGSIALVRGRSVSGGVRDDLGMVVAGARVRVRAGGPVGGRPGRTDRSARTGSDGGFVVHGLPLDETLSWEATADGHETARGALGGETRLEIVLTRAQRVFGRLVDEEGRPVAGAPLNVSYVTETRTKDAAGNENRHTMVEGHPAFAAGEDGTFSFHRRLPASVRIVPEADGFLPETKTLDPIAEGGERGELDLGDVVLRAGRTLAGRVAKADGGEPVAGATLEASWSGRESGSHGSVRGVSEADGSFRLEAIPPGREVTLTARKGKFAPKTLAISPETDSVDVLLSRGGRVSGRVCGTPWELGAAAVWYGRDGGYSNRNQATVDSAGRFTLENAEAGVLTFVRSWRFRDPARPGSTYEWSGAFRADVEVEEGKASEVSLGCDGIPVSGVITRAGRPVVSEIVSFSSETSVIRSDALTDAAGRFSTRVPAPGLWRLSAGGGPLSNAAACEVPPGGLDGCRVELGGAGQ